MSNQQNPFKGLYSYEEKDQHNFSGRDRDVNTLFGIVTANVHTMVYGKSGIGKTSLLQAGLFPWLRRNNYLPVPIRLSYSSSIPLKNQIIQRVQDEWNNPDIPKMEKGTGVPSDSLREGETLWEYFQRTKYIDRSGSQWSPVLVLDQFEEIFTVGKNHPEREALAKELACLVEKQVDENLGKIFLEVGGIPPYKVRIVLGLREDYLPDMDWLEQQIPSLPRVTFRVPYMNGEQARLVMVKYEKFRDIEIQKRILRHFYPRDAALGETVEEEKLEVEPSLLSFLCYQMVEKGTTSLSEKEKDAILSDFYDEELSKLPHSHELTEFIETKLLTKGGIRTPLPLEHTDPLRGAVEAAVNRKILRKVYYGEREYVEIIHDVLVPIIKERRRRRLEKKQNQEIRRKQIIYQLVAFVGLIFIILGTFALIQKNRADIQYKEAASNGLAAQSALVMPADNIESIRMAEAAYKIGMPHPSPSVHQVLSATAYSTFERPFYSISRQYEDHVAAVSISPRGTKILTISLAGRAKLWDMEGALLTDFSKHSIKINTAIFSPDGTRIITLSRDKTARLWDLNGNLLADLNRHTDKVWNAVFSPDSSKIVTTSDDKTAKLWDLKGNLLADFNKHTARVSNAAFSSDGVRVVTTSWDNTAKLWDLNGKLLADLNKHRDYVWSAAFSLDSARIITASSDKTVKIWDLDGKLLTDLELTDRVWSAAFSPDGNTILTRLGNTVKLWDLSGKLLADLTEHAADVSDAVFSHDGSKILTCSENTAKLWDVKGHLLVDLCNHTDTVSRAIFSRDGTARMLTCSGNTVKLWDVENSLLVDLNKSMGTVRNAAFSPDGSKILTWSANIAKLWDLKGNLLAELNKHIALILSVAFSPDGSKILTGSWDNTAKLWDLKGNLLTDLNKHSAQVSSVAFLPDGNKIFTVAQYNTVALWDLNGNMLAKLQINMDEVENAILSPDGDRMITWSGSGNIANLWDIKGNHLAVLKQHTDSISNAAFSSNSAKVITVSRDNTAKLWDLRGNLLTDIKKHTGPVTGAVFSPGGTQILTASDDNTAKLCDLKGNLLADLNKHTSPVLAAAFIENGKRILTVSRDGTIKRWYTPEAIMEWLKTASIPKLTREDKKNLGVEEFDID